MSVTNFLGRVCFAAIFIASGLSKFQDSKAAMGYAGYGLAKFGVTDPTHVAAAFFTAAVLELVGGVLVVLGQQKLGAAMIAAFLVPVTAALHDPRSGDQNDMIAFMKNLSLLGACLMMLGAKGASKAAAPAGKKSN